MKGILKGLLPVLLSTALAMIKQTVEKASTKNNNGYLLRLNSILDALHVAYKQKRPFEQVFKDPETFNDVIVFTLGLLEDGVSSATFRRMAGDQQGKLVAVITALKAYLVTSK